MNNDLFRICQKPDLADSYACCLRHCGSARICKALCRNVYAGTIPEDCAGALGCARPDYNDSKCIQDKQIGFNQCCLQRCRAGQWSDSASIANEFRDLPPIDCVAYCQAAPNIMLDQRFGPLSPYKN